MVGALLPPEDTNMTNPYQELVQYYSQLHHVPIDFVTEGWQLECQDQQRLLVALPNEPKTHRVFGKMIIAHDPDFGKCVGGDIGVVEDVPMARVGSHSLVLLFQPKNPTAMALARKLIDEHLPRLCRRFRHAMRDQMIEKFTGCVTDHKRDLIVSIRDDDYELERLGLQMMQLSRKLEGDRQVLHMFEKSPEWIKARATRCFFDLMKLVPGTFASFHFNGDSVFGTTHEIEIEHDGYTYHFDPFVVEVNMRKGSVMIAGGSDVNGYVHPHVTDDPTNVCWGNIGHLVSRLAGSLELCELYQLVHQFLISYNENDPFQKIEKWNPDWSEDDESEEPYCSWCDEYGHDVCDCEDCFWCEHCQHYEEHCSEDCPNRPKEEEEANAELEETTA
jgi:hypothetical protein